MSRRRQERMAVELKKVLSRILQEEIKDPRLDFSAVSVSQVELSNDLSHARVFISIMGDDEKQQETMKALEKARGFIRSRIAEEIQVRHVPEIDFRLDRSIEHGIRISSLLDKIMEEGTKSEE
ncbi:MAG: 30S ribosome-binding factor RbfA [Syntrophomonadaceae bacterium]|jgi:ribosome-binding factor A|nr:30S ribosome-binding factor RbfA [Bacillota bacterium]NLM88023.1 30S ribosome-binding factor RbfA [Syntrophomonadaceae bacterium]HAA08218.1 30S ribosome-binding factor RbfA [Syntrophomonas sp.]